MFLIRQEFIFLKYILHIIFTYIYTKALLLCLIKTSERISKKEKKKKSWKTQNKMAYVFDTKCL